MKKKGFTLVELLAVILILAVLIGISITSYIKIRNNTLEAEYKNIVKYLEEKAVEYADDTNITIVSVEDLIKAGYVKADDEIAIYDPRDNTSMNCYIIESTLKDGKYEAKLGENLIENGKCKDYTKTSEYQICEVKDGSCIDTDFGDWIKTQETITLGVNKGGKLLGEGYTFKWSSTTGNNSTDSTITVNGLKDKVYVGTYKAEVKKDNELGTASARVRIDNENPSIISTDYPEKDWSKEKTVTIKAIDNEGSGIDKVYLSTKETCKEDTEYIKESRELVATIDKNGIYYACAKDNVGNISNINTKKIVIEKLEDENKIAINLTAKPIGNKFISSTKKVYSKTIELTGTAATTESEIVGYQFTKTADEPTSNWHKIAVTNSTIQKNSTIVNKNGTYYFWIITKTGDTKSVKIVVDAYGELIKISNWVISGTPAGGSDQKLTASYDINSNFDKLVVIKATDNHNNRAEIKDINYVVNDNKINVTVGSGVADRVYVRTDHCLKGGNLSGSSCVVATRTLDGKDYNQSYGCGPSGEYESWGDDLKTSTQCSDRGLYDGGGYKWVRQPGYSNCTHEKPTGPCNGKVTVKGHCQFVCTQEYTDSPKDVYRKDYSYTVNIEYLI